MLSLPSELVGKISGYVKKSDVASLSGTCKSLYIFTNFERLSKSIVVMDIIGTCGLDELGSIFSLFGKTTLKCTHNLFGIVSSLITLYPREVNISSETNISMNPSILCKETEVIEINVRGSALINWKMFPNLKSLRITSDSVDISNMHECKNLETVIIHVEKTNVKLPLISKLKKLKYVFTNIKLDSNTIFSSTLKGCISGSKVCRINSLKTGSLINKTDSYLNVRSFSLRSIKSV
jgi:hypothetical protein